jgi:hypothetical protein
MPTLLADRRLSESGVILIALLWILTALSVIALSFSRESRVEVAAARNAQSLEESYFVARAGIATSIYQLVQRRYVPALRQSSTGHADPGGNCHRQPGRSILWMFRTDGEGSGKYISEELLE